MRIKSLFALCRLLALGLVGVIGLAPRCFADEALIATAITPAGDPVPYILNNAGNSPRYVLILFPGGNGVVNPHLEDGQLVYDKKGNFLLRARPFWVDGEFATATTNSSADEARIQALIDDLKKRFPDAALYLVGTSRGTYDTMALAGYLADKIAGEIHTSSLAAIGSFDAHQYKNRQLIVHHALDACRVTPFYSAKSAHERFGTELIVMEGGSSVGPACEAFAYHGYNGIEAETVARIKAWIKQAPATP